MKKTTTTMKQSIVILLAVLTLAACTKRPEVPKEPDPIPVKITAWTISNQFNQSRWLVNVTIDKPLDEEVTITCEFTTMPEGTKVTVPIKLQQGWVNWFGPSSVSPATSGSSANPNVKPVFTIKGAKKYNLSY